MAYASGTVEVGADPVAVCAVPPGGVRIRNIGQVDVFIGGAGVTAEGYPVAPGTSEDFPGSQPKESPIVPAPASDTASPQLYARTAGDAGKIAFITL